MTIVETRRVTGGVDTTLTFTLPLWLTATAG